MPAVDERLEVEHRVVAVEHHVGIVAGIELGQLGEGRRQGNGEVGALGDQRRARRVAGDDTDPVGGVERLQDGQPLQELVGARLVVGEVGKDTDAVHPERDVVESHEVHPQTVRRVVITQVLPSLCGTWARAAPPSRSDAGHPSVTARDSQTGTRERMSTSVTASRKIGRHAASNTIEACPPGES